MESFSSKSIKGYWNVFGLTKMKNVKEATQMLGDRFGAERVKQVKFIWGKSMFAPEEVVYPDQEMFAAISEYVEQKLLEKSK